MPSPGRQPRPVERLALSRVEVAVAIEVSVGSVDKMVEEGFLPPPRQWHTRKIWLVSEVEAYLNGLPVAGDKEQARISGRNPWDDEPQNHVADDPLQQWYRKVGFDPKTMNNDDWRRLRWRASVPGTPLGKLERGALLQFRKYSVGELIETGQIKPCGPATSESLEARGFIEIVMREPDRWGWYRVTTAGLQAAEALAQRSEVGSEPKASM